MTDVVRTSNERATFEQWAAKRGFTLEISREGDYLNTHTLDAWSAWEAAIQTTECGIRNGQYRYCTGHWRDKSNRTSHETRCVVAWQCGSHFCTMIWVAKPPGGKCPTCDYAGTVSEIVAYQLPHTCGICGNPKGPHLATCAHAQKA